MSRFAFALLVDTVCVALGDDAASWMATHEEDAVALTAGSEWVNAAISWTDRSPGGLHRRDVLILARNVLAWSANRTGCPGIDDAAAAALALDALLGGT